MPLSVGKQGVAFVYSRAMIGAPTPEDLERRRRAHGDAGLPGRRGGEVSMMIGGTENMASWKTAW